MMVQKAPRNEWGYQAMAYTATMAAALSGATINQLRHWRHAKTGPLLAPEISTSPRVFYSFRDLLALRTFVHLRQDASLQKIRVAIRNLRDLGEHDHLASYKLVSDRRGNVQLIKGDDEAIYLVRQPGQKQLLVVMGTSLSHSPYDRVWSCRIFFARGSTCPSNPTPSAASRSSGARACPMTRWP